MLPGRRRTSAELGLGGGGQELQVNPPWYVGSWGVWVLWICGYMGCRGAWNRECVGLV